MDRRHLLGAGAALLDSPAIGQTPRHAVAAVTIGDWIHAAGGGAVLGGMVQSALHEAFTLS